MSNMSTANTDFQAENDKILIHKQLQFTELIMNISTSFVNLPVNEVDNAVHKSLEEISKFVEADQSFIIYYDFYNKLAKIDYEWCSEGFSSRKEILQNIPMDKMDNWIDTHLKGEIVYVYDIDSYDQPNVRASVSPYGIKSVIAIPMMDNGVCIGYVSFDSIEQNHIYTDIEQDLFKVFVQQLVNLYKRRQSIAEIKQNEERYRLLFENNPEPMFIVNLETLRFIEVNSSAIEHYGYTHKEFLNMTLKDIRPNEDISALDENLKMILKHNRSKVYARHLKKNGELMHVEVTSIQVTWDNMKAVHMLINDTTEKVFASAKLQVKKDLLNKIINESSSFIYSNYDTINYKGISELMREISGATMVALNIYDINGKEYMIKSFIGNGDFSKNSINVLGYNLLEKKWEIPLYPSVSTGETTMIKYNSINDLQENSLPEPVLEIIRNSYNIGEIVIIHIAGEDKRLGCFVLFFHKGDSLRNSDIAELYASQIGLFLIRVEFEKSLLASEEKYRYLFENNPQPMWIYNIDSLAFLEVNKSAITTYGFTHEEFLSMTLFDICPPEDIPEFVKMISNVKGKQNNHHKRRHLLKNGDTIYVEISSTPVIYDGQKGRHVLINDITKRKIAEDDINKRLSELMDS